MQNEMGEKRMRSRHFNGFRTAGAFGCRVVYNFSLFFRRRKFSCENRLLYFVESRSERKERDCRGGTEHEHWHWNGFMIATREMPVKTVFFYFSFIFEG